MVPVGVSFPMGLSRSFFTDVEGSTKLLHELGVDQYARVTRNGFEAQAADTRLRD
jgi:hypothetical protein